MASIRPATLRLVTRHQPATTAPALLSAFSTTSTSFSSSPSSSSSGSRFYSPPTPLLLSHLDSLLKPINVQLDPTLAERALTHKSAVVKKGEGEKLGEKAAGHGEKLAFVGRRVLRLHLATYLATTFASSPLALAQHLSQASLDSILETKELGANLGREWGLEKIMRWREVRLASGEFGGLYKSRGSTVEALVGAVYSQHGIDATAKLFNSLVLPSLSLPRTLAKELDASLSGEIGGAQSTLRVEGEGARSEAGL